MSALDFSGGRGSMLAAIATGVSGVGCCSLSLEMQCHDCWGA